MAAAVAAMGLASASPGAASADATQYDCAIDGYRLNLDGNPMTGFAYGDCVYTGDTNLRRTTFTITDLEGGGDRKNSPSEAR